MEQTKIGIKQAEEIISSFFVFTKNLNGQRWIDLVHKLQISNPKRSVRTVTGNYAILVGNTRRVKTCLAIYGHGLCTTCSLVVYNIKSGAVTIASDEVLTFIRKKAANNSATQYLKALALIEQ